MPRRTVLPILLAASLLAPGCVSYHRFRPTANEHAGIGRAGNTGDMNDAAVIAYADQVRDILRKRFHIARNVRQTAASAQVLLAGAAGLAGAFEAGATTVATLAGSSAAIPQLSEIFDTGSRAIAYQQAVAKISEAEGAYYQARAGRSPVVPASALTIEGALLLDTVNAATSAVELFQAGMLPTLDQMKRLEATELHLRAARVSARAGSGGEASRRIFVTDEGEAREREERRREQAAAALAAERRAAAAEQRAAAAEQRVAAAERAERAAAERAAAEPLPGKQGVGGPQPKPADPDPGVFDEQATRVSLGSRVGRLTPGKVEEILKRFGRTPGSTPTSNRDRLKTFVTEADVETLRQLDKAIP